GTVLVGHLLLGRGDVLPALPVRRVDAGDPHLDPYLTRIGFRNRPFAEAQHLGAAAGGVNNRLHEGYKVRPSAFLPGTGRSVRPPSDVTRARPVPAGPPGRRQGESAAASARNSPTHRRARDAPAARSPGPAPRRARPACRAAPARPATRVRRRTPLRAP